MSVLAHNLNIRHNSWHSRWYRHWITLGGKPALFKENLCRYVRILLIWAPLRWSFKGRVATYIPPWVIGLTSGFLAFIGVALYLWPDIILRVLWITGAIMGGIILSLGVILLGSYLYDRDPQRTKTLAKWLTSPLWIIPAVLIYGLVWLWKKFERKFGRQLDAFSEFIGPLLALSAVLAILAFIGYEFYDKPIKTAIVLGSLLGAAVLLIGGVALGEWLKERRQIAKPQTRLGRAYEGVADTVKLGATYIATKKRGSRICPFLNFENAR